MTGPKRDPRRYRVIETRQRGASLYVLTIDGVVWAEVEWSASRRAWCIQDPAGHCLTHVEHVHAAVVDAQKAVRLAKRMIIDGRMPAPEEAQGQLKKRLERDRLGEPFFLDMPQPVSTEPRRR